MIPQPPTNVDTHSTSVTVRGSEEKKSNWLIWLVIISVLLGVCVFFALLPMFICSKKDDQSEAFSNARQIGIALTEFETEYGSFPNEETAAQIKAKNPTDLHLAAKTSNDVCRQLIASGIVSSEQMFYAKVKGARKPDSIITEGEVVKKGECGFSFLSELSSGGNRSRPLVVTPLIHGTDRFDPKPFQGKAVILRMDNSVTSLPINEDGHVLVDGMNLLDPRHPIWGGKPFVIVWPE
jgi:hypothetical protein